MDPYRLLRQYIRELGAGLLVIVLLLSLLAAFINLVFGSRRAGADVPPAARLAECQVPSLQLVTSCTPRHPR